MRAINSTVMAMIVGIMMAFATPRADAIQSIAFVPFLVEKTCAGQSVPCKSGCKGVQQKQP